MIVEWLIHYKSPNVVFVIVSEAKLYLRLPVLLQLHVYLLLVRILYLSRLEIFLLGLNNAFHNTFLYDYLFFFGRLLT